MPATETAGPPQGAPPELVSVAAPFERLAVAVLAVTPDGDVTYTNPAWSHLTGMTREASRGKGWMGGLEAPIRSRLLREVRAGDGTVDCTIRTPHGMRWSRWCWERPAEPAAPRVVTVIDLSADHRREVELSRRAARDPLTGIANRRTFLEELKEALARDGRRGVGVVYADLDGFKDINDGGGHALGDLVLRLVAQRFRQHLRGEDLLGRVGGDEFAVLCAGRTSEIMAVAERMAKALHDPFTVDGSTLAVSATVGVAIADGPDDEPEVLLDRADRAMYSVKRETVGRHPGIHPSGEVTAGPPLRLTADSADRLIRQLFLARTALECGEAGSATVSGARLAGVRAELDDALRLLRLSAFDPRL